MLPTFFINQALEKEKPLLIDYDDDFQTAQTQTDDNLKKELIDLKKDVEVVFDRVKLLNEQFISTVDAMDCN